MKKALYILKATKDNLKEDYKNRCMNDAERALYNALRDEAREKVKEICKTKTQEETKEVFENLVDLAIQATTIRNSAYARRLRSKRNAISAYLLGFSSGIIFTICYAQHSVNS